MTSQNLKPLLELQANATHFFNQFYQKHQANMQCKIECSQCCYVELSIFEGEAVAILEWVKNLTQEKKFELLDLLQKPLETKLKTKKSPCTFLTNNKCSIYEARPIICRTQGAVLQYKTISETHTQQIHVDVCPLNFKKSNTFPDQKEWLDLDRLSSLQSIAENNFQSHKNTEFNLKKNKFGRIELKTLKEKIIQLLI